MYEKLVTLKAVSIVMYCEKKNKLNVLYFIVPKN